MAWPGRLQVALKEWASVCSAMGEGRQILLLRKGGIYEAAGEFEVEHRQFLLFPTYLHQNVKMLKPLEEWRCQSLAQEPAEITLSLAGSVTDILHVESRGQMDGLDEEHIWTGPLVDMRFNYRPENPLYLLLVRIHRLRQPVTIANTLEYAGCKSWVALEQAVATADAEPVLSEALYAARRQRILRQVYASVG